MIVHAITEKGRGYAPARADEADQFHAVGDHRPGDRRSRSRPAARRPGPSVFADEIVDLADERPDIVGITGGDAAPGGPAPFAERFPERVFDVGIAEQHAVTSAAGLAFGGLHPVVAIYATFMNRAFDQVLMDVALHRPASRSCSTGPASPGPTAPATTACGTSRCCRSCPGIRIAAPRDATRLREELREAVAVDDAPTRDPLLQGQRRRRRCEPSSASSDGVDVLARRPAGPQKTC